MIPPRLTKTTLREHFGYHLWIYLLIFALVFFAADGAIGVIKNNIPPTDRLIVLLVGDVYRSVDLERVHDELRADTPDIKHIELRHKYLIIAGQQPGEELLPGTMDVPKVLANQDNQIVAMGMTGLVPDYADAVILHVDLLNYFAAMGAVQPLDGYFEDGTLDARLREFAIYAQDAEGRTIIVGLSAKPLRRFSRLNILETAHHASCIAETSGNKDAAARALAWLYENAAR